jgi:hypothetical protein
MGKDAEGSHNVLFPGGNEQNRESPSQKKSVFGKFLNFTTMER